MLLQPVQIRAKGRVKGIKVSKDQIRLNPLLQQPGESSVHSNDKRAAGSFFTSGSAGGLYRNRFIFAGTHQHCTSHYFSSIVRTTSMFCMI